MGDDCLRIPEVIRLIYDEVDKKTSLSLALTSKNFLEAGLDRIWKDITSFMPLISCLPDDMWRLEILPVPRKRVFNIFMSPRRDITPQDLRRYLRYYAHRIRRFKPHFHARMKILSIEAFQAIQIATEYQTGILSPRLQEFHWYRPQQCISALGESFGRLLAPFMVMFLGKTVASLTLDVDASDPPVYVSSTRLLMKQLPLLRTLSFGLAGPSEGWTHPSLWKFGNLERLKVGGIPVSIIPYLAELPNLASLIVNGIQTQSFIPPTQTNPGGFSSLTTLDGCSESPSDIRHILRHLSGHSVLQTIEWCHSFSAPLSDYQAAIDAIAEFCCPRTLHRVELYSIDPAGEEKLDQADEELIDVSPLFKFTNLRELTLNLAESVSTTPELLAQLPSSWPHIERLALCPAVPSSQTPLIDHSHLLEASRKMQSLRVLGMRFDSTRITAQEPIVTGEVAQLRTLLVGESPICSPSRVSTFLKSGFPYLMGLDDCYGSVSESERRGMSAKRWGAVHDALQT